MTIELAPPDRKKLLAFARETMAARLGLGPAAQPPEGSAFEISCGGFVSLHEEGALRGCIGRITASGPLLETIRSMAESAAFEDPRFEPLSASELPRVKLEITLLSPLKRIDDVSEIEVGKHGIYIVRGWHSGILLPQVAVEYGWDRATFLQQVCHKAGMQADAWRAPDTELFIFEGLVFGEQGD